MTEVFVALAVSVDGYITGPDPSPELPLGRGGGQLFDWYTDGDTPSRVFTDFRLSARSAPVFDAVAARVGAVLAGRRTYDDSNGFAGGGPHPNAPLFVLTHTVPADVPRTPRPVFVTDGIVAALSRAKQEAAATGKDVALMGGGVVAEALRVGLLDEVTMHQVPVLLGGGTPLFGVLPDTVRLRRVGVVEAPGVTHLSFRVERSEGQGAQAMEGSE